jgi:hypothetical protein
MLIQFTILVKICSNTAYTKQVKGKNFRNHVGSKELSIICELGSKYLRYRKHIVTISITL